MVRLGEITPVVWDTVVAYMEIKFKKFDFQEDDIMFDWRPSAKALKLERELYEIYGPFKDVILHPITQYMLELWNKYVILDFTLGEPLLPLTTAIVILFMLHKRVNNFILALAGAFVFNLNPLYVVVCAFLWWISLRGGAPKQYKKIAKIIVPAEEVVVKPFASYTPFDSFDYVLIGNDVNTFYAAASLSRVGYKCCVLSPNIAPPIDVHPTSWAASVPLQTTSVGRPLRYQTIIDTVQSKDPAKRVVLTPVGTPENGFAHTVLVTHSGSAPGSSKGTKALVLQSGEQSVASAVANKHAIDKTNLSQHFQKILQCYDSMSSHLATKFTYSSKSAENKSEFAQMLTHSCKSILQPVVEDSDVFETIASVAIAGASEPLPAGNISVIALAAAISLSEEGVYYPTGGGCSLIKAMTETILESGGVVLADVPVDKVVVETLDKGGFRATGVAVEGGAVVKAEKGVISGAGILCTCTHLLQHKFVDQKTREILGRCLESRPKFFVLFDIKGTSDELGLSDCEYVEVGKQDINNCEGMNNEERLSESYLKLWSPTTRDAALAAAYGSSIVVVEMCADSSVLSRAEQVFTEPSCLDDGSSVTEFIATKSPVLYRSVRQPLMSGSMGAVVGLSENATKKALVRATTRLLAAYPKCNGRITKTHIVPPVIGGHSMVPDISRCALDLSAASEVQALYSCSTDLTAPGLQGQFQAGYLGASAALGYNVADITVGRNLITDMQNIAQ